MNTKKNSPILCLSLCGAFLLLALSGCEGIFDFKADDKPLAGVEWNLLAFENPVGKKSNIGSQGMLLFFEDDTTFKGRSYTIKGDLSMPGNSYFGIYKVGTEGSLSMGGLGTTQVGLPSGSRYDEYLGALHNASSYKIDGKKLRIFYNNKKKALEFKAP
jgi:hypothetical protein